MLNIRNKLYLTILPLVVLSLLLSGFFSSLWSRLSLIRAANRHLAYKAEQLRDYIYSEWNVLEKLKLSQQEQYQNAAKSSFYSYAYSLIRSETEQILVFTTEGNLVFRIGLKDSTGTSIQHEPIPPVSVPQTGWFTGELYGEKRVGVAFPFDPFGWTIAITELEESFFSEVKRIQIAHIGLLVITVIIVIILVTLLVRHIVGPLERLTRTIEQIRTTGDLSFRAKVEYKDEIGVLAERFNFMIETIQTDRIQLEQLNRAEKQAREAVTQREYETLYILGRLSDYRDEKTGSHQRRIGSYASLFAQLLGKDEQYQLVLQKSAPLHDIGKISVPDAILLKPGKLTNEEFEIIKKHTIWGYELLKDTQSTYLSEGAIIALTHHERWNGTGYPQGLAEEATPLSGRIISLIDVYDALISERSYKAPWSPEEALRYIVSQKGNEFDPQLAELFENHFSEFCAIQ